MKILHISKLDTSGGAAQAAYRLHRGLCAAGYSSTFFVNYKTREDPTVIAHRPGGSLLHRCLRFIRHSIISRDFEKYRTARTPEAGWFSDDRSRYGGAIIRQFPVCDVINLHWIAGFVDYRAFFENIQKDIPIVWRLSDMNPFTGGCHYNEGCEKYNSGCGRCPQLNSNDPQDLSRQIWQRKKALYDRIEANRLHFVAQSRWMADEIKNSVLLNKFQCTTIPNGLDTDDFSPRDRNFSRELLGLPPHKKIIFFIANNINVTRKGFRLLKEALEGLADKSDILLLSAGNGRPSAGNRFEVHNLGPVDNDRYLSAVYSSADLFVIPSLQDTLPNTVLESMACGTPVVGFNTGGIPDMVKEGRTGSLVSAGDSDGLRNAIERLLADNQKRNEMSARCRQIACRQYAIEIQTAGYFSLYEKLLTQMRTSLR